MTKVDIGNGENRPEETDWNGALREQENTAAMESRRSAKMEQSKFFDGYLQLEDQMGMERRQMNETRGNAIASMMKLLQLRGAIPRNIMGAFSRDMGFDGKNQALVDAGMAKNGTFVMRVANRDPQTGKVGIKSMSFDPMQRYKIMLSKPGIFDRKEVGAMALELNRRFGFKESEIPMPDDTYWGDEAAQMNAEDRIGTRTPEGAVRVRGSWLAGPEKRGGSSFSADGKGGFTRSAWDGNGNRVDQDGGTRAEGAQGRWKVLRSGFISDEDDYGTVYENDKTGETTFVRRGETPPWQKQTGGTDKMAIEQMRQDGLDRRAAAGNKTKIDLAKMGNDSREKINAEREKGRQARAVLRDEQAWGKLALEWEKADNSFAVQMKKADTYGKRVDLIERKIDRDYEVALKKVKNEEDRLALDEAYKNAKLDLEEGRLDLDWVKTDNAFVLGEAKNAETTRHNKAMEENVAKRNEIALKNLQTKASGGDKTAQNVLNDALRLKRIIDDSTGKETEEAKANALSQYNAILEGYGKAPIKSGDNGGNGTGSSTKPSKEEAIKKLLATGRYKLENGKVVPK